MVVGRGGIHRAQCQWGKWLLEDEMSTRQHWPAADTGEVVMKVAAGVPVISRKQRWKGSGSCRKRRPSGNTPLQEQGT